MALTKLHALTIAAGLAIAGLCIPTAAYADHIRDQEWHLTYLKVIEAQRITRGKGVIVAVVDSGVYPHPDLRGNLLRGTDVIPGASGDGRTDSDGHGTEMAGIIAAHGRNSRDGILGIAPDAKILPVKYASATYEGNSADIATAIEWATQNDAKIINVSSAAGPSLALNEAVSKAANHDSLVVAGSGNRPEFINFGYPAAMPGVLSVGAVNHSGKHADFSVSGAQMQICAPGVDIVSTLPRNGYSSAWGTSEATAIVSGAAALVRAKYPNLSAPEVIHRLTATATDIGKPGRDDECGYGVLNIVKALTADVPPLGSGTSGQPAASATASSTPDAAPGEPGGSAAPRVDPAGHTRLVVIVLGSGLAVIVLGGLLVLLAARRRRANS